MAEIKGSQADIQKVRMLEQERERKKQEVEQRRQAIAKDTGELVSISDKFQSNSGKYSDTLELTSTGLVSADEYRKRKQLLEHKAEAEKAAQEEAAAKAKKHRANERAKAASTLSFADDEEEPEFQLSLPAEDEGAAGAAGAVVGLAAGGGGAGEEAEGAAAAAGPAAAAGTGAGAGAGVARRVGKDPRAETDFLRDRQREQEEARLRGELEGKWAARQEEVKKEKIEIVYSYWDGSGHRKAVTVEKGFRVDQFLDKCRADLVGSFHELRGVSAGALIYVKEDLIIPHHYTFYDLIISKARGKSGPLFHFDVHDDVRMSGDARVEKDESHAGKVMTRGWYERNKHIFPASRWEVYDPAVKRDAGYTVKGGEVR